jgi:spore coat polysaccharide biosynthesis predicted glycosyltransferase SpsG
MPSNLCKKIAFRFDVSKKIGFGHFMRCLSIAEKLYKEYHFKIYFIVNKNFSSEILIKNKKIIIIHLKINTKNS